MLPAFATPSKLTAFFGLLVATTTYPTLVLAKDTDSTNKSVSESDTANVDSSAPEESALDAGDSTEPMTASPASSPAAKSEKGTSHQGQFGLRLAGVMAYRIVMRYDESPLCAEPDADGEPKKFCGFSAPFGLDTALTYAPLAGVEPFLWGRFGLGSESKTHTAPLLVFGAGVRLYTMSDAPFKFFIEPAIGAELEGRASGATDATGPSSSYKQDWLIRLSVGPQYDFNRYFGIYGAGAMTVGVARALHTFMELQFGLQARFP
jgi:hypothetical protein